MTSTRPANSSIGSYLAKLAEGRLKYLALAFEDLQVLHLPGAAVVRGHMSARVRRDGQEVAVASLFMTVWGCDTDGHWRLHAHQETPLPLS